MKFKCIQKLWVAAAITLITFFTLTTSSSAAAYYFCDTSGDHSPTNAANYANDEDCTDPAGLVPDNTVDEVTVVGGTTYDGDAIFNGISQNLGTVTGDATFNDLSRNSTGRGDVAIVLGDAVFNEDQSENNGTVAGTRTRYYSIGTNTTRDFTLIGDEVTPWTVVADGVVVKISGAIFDTSNVVFTTVNNGTFVDLTFLYSSVTDNVLKIVYDGTIDTTSVPGTNDFDVSVNNTDTDVIQVAIDGDTVSLTLNSSVKFTDTVYLAYIGGDTPIQSVNEVVVPNLNEVYVAYALLTDPTPFYINLVGDKVYVSNYDSATVSSINIITGETIATLGSASGSFYSSSIGNKLYVNNVFDTTVTVIDTESDSVVGNIDIGTAPAYSVIVNNKLYVAATTANAVFVIDVYTNTILGSISTGNNPGYLTVVGTKIYVSNADGTVSVLNTTTDSVIATISIENNALYSFAVGTKLYVNCGGTLSVVDTVTDTFVTNITVNEGSYSFSVLGTKLYVTGLDNVTSVVDTVSDTVIDTITVGYQTYFSTYFNKRLYVSNNGDNTVTVVDTDTDTVVDTLYVGKNTYHFAVVNGYVYVVVNNSSYISVINPSTVPSQLPNLTHFSTSTPSGTYSSGASISITAHFGRTLASGSTMTIELSTGANVTLNQVSGTTLSGTYTIAAGETTFDLFVREVVSANVSDTSGHTRTGYDLPSSMGDSDIFQGENSFISRNLGDTTNISINISPDTIPVGANPYQISPLINGSIYVANQGAGTVSVIDATTQTVTQTISVGAEPYGLAYTNGQLYVANTGSDTVSVIDTTSNTVSATIPVGVKPYYMTAIGTNAYVTNGASNTVSVIDSTTNTVSATIPVGSYPRGIKAHGTDLYVANYGDLNYSGGNYISVIDSTTNTVTDTIISPGGSDGPRGVTTLGSNVYVANFRSNNVSVIDTATNTITATIPVGKGPRGVAGIGTNLYVENFDDSTISVIDTISNAVTETIDVGNSPSGISIVGTDAYISSFQDNRVYKLNTLTNELYTTAVIEEVEEEPEPVRHSSGGSIAAILPPSLQPPVAVNCPVGDMFSRETGQRCTVLTTILPASNPSDIPSPYIFTRTLKVGMTGLDVQNLQKYLNTHNFFVSASGPGSSGLETTLFGSKTRAAVIKLQITKRLNGDGVVGPLTRALLK